MEGTTGYIFHFLNSPTISLSGGGLVKLSVIFIVFHPRPPFNDIVGEFKNVFSIIENRLLPACGDG